MALHQRIQQLLLLGANLDNGPAPGSPRPPQRLLTLIAAIEPAHRSFDERAVEFGHRYRSAFWAIYVLSAVAVLFAVLPPALGWDDSRHLFHPYVFLWPIGEVVIIGTVATIYWIGHRRDWQGQWLSARTQAELTSYLPLVAPLVDFGGAEAGRNWYARVMDPGQPLRADQKIDALCRINEPLAREALRGAWSDPAFVREFVRWSIDTMENQRHYHRGVRLKQHALRHRVHTLNYWLFGSTAIGALLHLVLHSLWLSLVTTFFPALGASLHGALAQSESYRLEVTSERLVGELSSAIERIGAAASEPDPTAAAAAIGQAVAAAIALILDEHHDWHMLVRPHHLPLG
jgi:hypothetical protein